MLLLELKILRTAGTEDPENALVKKLRTQVMNLRTLTTDLDAQTGDLSLIYILYLIILFQ